MFCEYFWIENLNNRWNDPSLAPIRSTASYTTCASHRVPTWSPRTSFAVGISLLIPSPTTARSIWTIRFARALNSPAITSATWERGRWTRTFTSSAWRPRTRSAFSSRRSSAARLDTSSERGSAGHRTESTEMVSTAWSPDSSPILSIVALTSTATVCFVRSTLFVRPEHTSTQSRWDVSAEFADKIYLSL